MRFFDWSFGEKLLRSKVCNLEICERNGWVLSVASKTACSFVCEQQSTICSVKWSRYFLYFCLKLNVLALA